MRDRSAFDLFQGLAQLGSRDFSWYNGLSDAGKKAAAPFVLMRWMAGTPDPLQILKLNELANPYMFSGGFEKSQQITMLAASATGKNKRYSWLKMPSSKSASKTVQAICQYYECSVREAKTYSVQLQDLLEIVAELGWEKEDVDKLKKEHPDVTAPDTKRSVEKRGAKTARKSKP